MDQAFRMEESWSHSRASDVRVPHVAWVWGAGEAHFPFPCCSNNEPREVLGHGHLE